MSLRSWITTCGWLAIVFGGLGFAASVGHGLLPPLPLELVAPLHLLLAALGLGAATIASRYGVEIDRERFSYAEDPHATRDERLLAHREAEREHRRSMTAMVAAPLALGYWIAYEFPPGEPWARALPVSALVGVGFGLLLLRLRRR